MATPRANFFPKEFCCATQIFNMLRSHGLYVAHPAGGGVLPAGFPSPTGSVQNGRSNQDDVTPPNRTDHDGASLMFALTGTAESPAEGRSYWRSSDVLAWLASQ